MSDRLAKFLHDRDVPCPGCGQNLRGALSDTCAACGEALVLRVSVAEPKLAAFVTGVVGLSLGLGFGALMFFLMIIDTFRKGYMRWEEILVTGGAGLAGAAALGAWIWLRSPVRRLGGLPRWLLAVLTFPISITLALLVFMALG